MGVSAGKTNSSGFHKHELFSTGRTKTRKTKMELAYKPLRRALRLGCLIGALPLKNCFKSSSLIHFKVQRLSIPYCCSVVLLLYKWLTLQQFWSLQKGYRGLSTSADTTVDHVACDLGFFFTFCFGPYVHIVCLLKLRSFLAFLQAIEVHDGTFYANYPLDHFREKLRIGKCFLVYNILISIGVIITPVYILYRVATSIPAWQSSWEFSILPGLPGPSNITFICIFVSLVYMILESSNLVALLQVIYSTKLLTSRVDGITDLVKRRLELKVTANSVAKSDTGSSWKRIGQQCTDLMEINQLYRHFIGPYFTTLSAVLITSFICMNYFVLTSKSKLAEDCGSILNVVVTATLGRILGMTNAGESLPVKYKELTVAMCKAYHVEAFARDEEGEFERCFHLITSTKMYTSASGYFVVSRKNVPSIISLIITYMVVLFQFKGGSNNTCNFLGNSTMNGNFTALK